MEKIPSLEVITSNNPENTISLNQIISERRILKTKVKLFAIALFDNDLKTLNKEGLYLKNLSLEDFKLTEKGGLVVPIYDKITPIKIDNILESYLIYLSYLYNIDFVSMYKTNYQLFYEILIKIDLPPELKMNLFELIKYHTGSYFSDNMEKLNSAEYRDKINADEKRIRKLII